MIMMKFPLEMMIFCREDKEFFGYTWIVYSFNEHQSEIWWGDLCTHENNVSFNLHRGRSVTCNWWITFTSNLISFDVSLFSHDIFSGRFFTNLKNVSIKLRKKEKKFMSNYLPQSSPFLSIVTIYRMRIDDRRRRSENIENIQKENWNSFSFFSFSSAQGRAARWVLLAIDDETDILSHGAMQTEIVMKFIIIFYCVKFDMLLFNLHWWPSSRCRLLSGFCWRWWKSVRFQESSPPSFLFAYLITKPALTRCWFLHCFVSRENKFFILSARWRRGENAIMRRTWESINWSEFDIG